MGVAFVSFPTPDSVRAIRHFNRFYTRQIGVLQEHLYRSQFSLTEVRVLYELAYQNNVTAGELCRELGWIAATLVGCCRTSKLRDSLAR